MGSCSSFHGSQEQKPEWTKAVIFRDEYYKDKIAAFSAGFRPINNNTVELVSPEPNTFDGARWSRGFTRGKHVVEFIYPVHLRKAGARVGLGIKATILGGKDKSVNVGGHNSWALDLVTRKAMCNNKNVKRFPRGKVLPDWFFMYFDLDEGIVQFGSDIEFYGTAFTNLPPPTEPMYPIVTGTLQGAIIGIVYRGEGKEIIGPLRKQRTLTLTDQEKRNTCMGIARRKNTKW